MTVSLEELQILMNAMEGENLEFKEAKQSYQFDKLIRYCSALANEGGGKVILGISDQRPRRIIGSRAFTQPERTRAGLMEKLRLRVDVDVLSPSEGRVLCTAKTSGNPNTGGWCLLDQKGGQSGTHDRRTAPGNLQ